ncbi:MAG: helix-turn-helix domain-containing protein [Rhodospirillales bacterium]|nr:helix-turn-helix domain-containing protein [Rhodospirillales bacterium]
MLGIPRSTFYNWYDRYLSGGVVALADKKAGASCRLE